MNEGTQTSAYLTTSREAIRIGIADIESGPFRGFAPEAAFASHLLRRPEEALSQQIAAIVKKGKWTQTEAAQRCGVTQPRMNDLLRGRVSRFSLDALVNIATALGQRVHVGLEAA